MLNYLYVIALSALTLSARNTMYPSTGQVPSCNRNFSGRDQGTIESPKNLDDYGSHRLCNYLITVSYNAQVKLTFTYVKMTGTADWSLEYVVLFDGPDCMSRRIGTVFDEETPTFVSTNNKITALFISDKQANAEKFKANYAAVTGPKITEQTSSSEITEQTSSSEITEQTSSSENNRMLRSCGNELKGPFGMLSFSGRGWTSVLCIWRIEVEAGRKVHVHFVDLKLNTNYAWLRILDGGYCGAPVKILIDKTGVAPFNISSSYNKMTVIFSSAYDTPAAELLAYYSDGSEREFTTNVPETSSSGDLLTSTENLANNLAPSNTFSLVSNYLAYIIAGILLILIKIIAHFEMPISVA